ncbi:hypothetical protein ACF1CY_002597 [Providencia rettgeri]
MLILTTDLIPDIYAIQKVHGMVQVIANFEANRRGVIPSRQARVALEELSAAASEASSGEANAVYGVKATPLLNGGMLYIGTAVTLK